MSQKSAVKKIRHLLKYCNLYKQRALFFIVGRNASTQVSVLYQFVAKGKSVPPSVLWCCKNNSDLDRNNRNVSITDKQNESGSHEEENVTNASDFNPCYTSYSELHTVMHRSFGMVIFEDFEALTPHLLASVIENVRGGGAVVFHLPKLKALGDLTSLEMDFFLERGWSNVKQSRFNRRFVSTIANCPSCIVFDDELNILSPKINTGDIKNMIMKKLTTSENLDEIKSSNDSDLITSSLVNLCQTEDQKKLLSKCCDVLKKKTFHACVSASSPKGRGKSAALGLAIAGSIAMNYSNIFVSSLCFDNVKVLFKFLLKGLDTLGYQEDKDYDVIESANPELQNVLVGMNVFKDHPQAIRFVLPGDVGGKLEQAELVVIDEVAEIPLALLKHLLSSHVILMASSTSGNGATGKSLYEDVVTVARHPLSMMDDKSSALPTSLLTPSDAFEEITLSEPVYYSADDKIESWVNKLLCLESAIPLHLSCGCPEPQQCNLYCVNRDVLFSNHDYAEKFLQHLVSLFNSSKRRVSPDELFEFADAPDYNIFCLLPPSFNGKASSEILCAIMVHVEYKFPLNAVHAGSNQGNFVPKCFDAWKYNDEHTDKNYHLVTGIHILDIVTHPSFRRMGYGLRSLQLLEEYYSGKYFSLDENTETITEATQNITVSSDLLLLKLNSVNPVKANYLLISFGLTSALLRFWKKSGFVPSFISKEKDSASEHLCFMLKSLDDTFAENLSENWRCFREYYYVLLRSDFKSLSHSLALSILSSTSAKERAFIDLTKEVIDMYIKPHHMKCLEKYCQNLGDLHTIMPSIPIISKLYFRHVFKDTSLPCVQEAILLCVGLQHKSVSEIAKDLALPSSQVHGLLNRTIRKLTKYFADIIEKAIEKTISAPEIVMEPLSQELDDELEETAKAIKAQQAEEIKKLKEKFSQYAIKGTEDDWQKALQSGRKTLVSIKSIKRKPENTEQTLLSETSFKGKKKKHKGPKKHV